MIIRRGGQWRLVDERDHSKEYAKSAHFIAIVHAWRQQKRKMLKDGAVVSIGEMPKMSKEAQKTDHLLRKMERAADDIKAGFEVAKAKDFLGMKPARDMT